MAKYHTISIRYLSAPTFNHGIWAVLYKLIINYLPECRDLGETQKPRPYQQFFLNSTLVAWRIFLVPWLTLDAVPLRLVAELLEEEAAAVLAAEDLPAGQLARPHHLGAGGRGGAENLPDAGPAAGLQHLRGQWLPGP